MADQQILYHVFQFLFDENEFILLKYYLHQCENIAHAVLLVIQMRHDFLPRIVGYLERVVPQFSDTDFK